MGGKKKPRISLLARSALFFLLTLFLSLLVGLLFARKYVFEDAISRSYAISAGATTAAMTSLGSADGFYELFSDEEYRESIHKTFHFICEKTETDVLYLYTVDENKKRHYIVAAAKDSDIDEIIRDTISFDMIDEEELYPAEVRILEGKSDGEHEFYHTDSGYMCMFVRPVSSQGKIIAFVGASYDMDDILEESKRNLYFIAGLVILVFSIALISSLILMRKSIFVPVRSLSDRMRSFTQDIDSPVPKRKTIFSDEITDMESSFYEMTENMREYVGEIKTLTSDKVQVETQLDVARRIQSGLIPMEHFVLGDGCEIYGIEKPARAVGGDFYDIFRLDSDRICVVVGDISGKGVSAALFMVMVKTGIRENLRSGRSLTETFSFLNSEICFSNPETMFATVAAIILDTKTGVLQYMNGGHELPLLLSKEADYLELDAGCALGLFDDANAGEKEIRLSDGEGLLIFTDGVTEANDAEKNQFGKDRLRERVRDYYSGYGNRYESEGLIKDLMSGVSGFCKDAEQFDDITCVALIYRDNEKERRRLTMDLASSLPVLRDTIFGGIDDEERAKTIILVCEEIFTNIVNYSGAKNVSFYFERTEKLCAVTFFDDGVPFDPVTVNLRDKAFEELDTGGMGIRLARMNTKEMVYNRIDNTNQLVLRFETETQP